MENAIRTAIYQRTLQAASIDSTNLFYVEAPQQSSEDPIIVFSQAANPSEKDTKTNIEIIIIQFSIYSKVLTTAENVRDEICELFDDRDQSIFNNLLSSQYSLAGIKKISQRDLKKDKDFFNLIVQYHIELNTTAPNTLVITESDSMFLYGDLGGEPAQDEILIEFDLFMPSNVLPYFRADGSYKVWQPFNANYIEIINAYFCTSDYFTVLTDGYVLLVYSNDINIDVELNDYEIFNRYAHFRIHFDFINELFTIEWGRIKATSALSPGLNSQNFDGIWQLFSTQSDSNSYRMKTLFNTDADPRNPYISDRRPRFKIKNWTGNLAPNLSAAFLDMSKTIPAKIGNRAVSIECADNFTLDSALYDDLSGVGGDDVLIPDDPEINYHLNGNFETNKNYWTAHNGYPSGSDNFASFNVFSPAIKTAGYNVLRGITGTTYNAWQGAVALFGSGTTTMKMGAFYIISQNIFIAESAGYNAGSRIKARLWWDDGDGNSYTSFDTEIDVGKWHRLKMRVMLSLNPAQQSIRHGIFFYVSASPLTFYIDDVRIIKTYGGFKLALD